MSANVEEIFPEDFSSWKIETDVVLGRLITTARRTGVTLHLIREPDGWWDVTRFKGGRKVAEITTRNVPPEVVDEIRRRRPHPPWPR